MLNIPEIPRTVSRRKLLQALEILGIDPDVTSDVSIGSHSITVKQSLFSPGGSRRAHAELTYTMEITP
jgi:hypothetical protein